MEVGLMDHHSELLGRRVQHYKESWAKLPQSSSCQSKDTSILWLSSLFFLECPVTSNVSPSREDHSFHSQSKAQGRLSFLNILLPGSQEQPIFIKKKLQLFSSLNTFYSQMAMKLFPFFCILWSTILDKKCLLTCPPITQYIRNMLQILLLSQHSFLGI